MRDFAPGPLLMNPLLNVILVPYNNFSHIDLRHLPKNVRAVVTPMNIEMCYLKLMGKPEQVSSLRLYSMDFQ